MLYRMLVNVGIKTYIDKKTWKNLKIKPINVGIKIYISLKSAVSAVLKECSKTLENLI